MCGLDQRRFCHEQSSAHVFALWYRRFHRFESGLQKGRVGTAPSRYEDPDDAERKKRWFQMNDKWAEQKINEVYLQSQC